MSFLDHFTETKHPYNLIQLHPIKMANIIYVGGVALHKFYIPKSLVKITSTVDIIYSQGFNIVLKKERIKPKYLPVLKAESNSEFLVELSENETSLFRNTSMDNQVQIKLNLNTGEALYLPEENFEVKITLDYKADKAGVNIKSFIPPYILRLRSYLYEASFPDIDYDYATKYYSEAQSQEKEDKADCSAVRIGNYYGRNYDWNYNDEVEFVVHVARGAHRQASLGVQSHIGDNYTEYRVKNGLLTEDELKIIPFRVVDGINEHGLFCNVNVVSALDNPNPTTKTGVAGKQEISVLNVVRWVLDHYSSADEAIEGLKSDVRIFYTTPVRQLGYEYHWMIGDEKNTYVVEIIDNRIVAIKWDSMFNFYRNGVVFNEDGSLYGPKEASYNLKPSEVNKLGLYSAGIERHNLWNKFKSEHNQEDMDKLSLFYFMTGKTISDTPVGLAYTNTYNIPQESQNLWCTEFQDYYKDLEISYTVDTPISVYNESPIIKFVQENFKKRERVGMNVQTWHTEHTSIYEIAQRKLMVAAQEDGNNCYQFDIWEETDPHVCPAEKIYQTREYVDQQVNVVSDKIDNLVLDDIPGTIDCGNI